MFWSKILRFFSEDIAMGLGTANTLLYLHGVPTKVKVDE